MTIYSQNKYKVVNKNTGKPIEIPEGFYLDYADDNLNLYSLSSKEMTINELTSPDGKKYKVRVPVRYIAKQEQIRIVR